MTKRLLILSLFLLSYKVFSQDSSTFNFGLESHMQYYIDDKVTGDFTQGDPFRSNNYLKADYKIKGFTVGFQVESYMPQALLNFAPDFDKKVGLGMYYARYKSNTLNIQAGHFFAQYGSGLILRSWEDRQLGLNNAIMGLNVGINITDNTKVSAMAGKQRIGFKLSEAFLTGFDFNHSVVSFLNNDNYTANFGLSYVGRRQVLDSITDDLNAWTHAATGRYQMVLNNFYTGGEYVYKTKDFLVENGKVMKDKVFSGNGLQFNFGYSKRGFAINTTLRRLENMPFYIDRNLSGNTYNVGIVNYVPALTKQHDYSLSNLYVYQAQSSLQFQPLEKTGELGGQLDLFYRLKKGTALGGKYGTKLSFNMSKWYGLMADYIPAYKRVDVSLLASDKHYFSDYSLEVRKKLSRKVSGILNVIRTDYNKKYIEESKGMIHANVVIAESTIKMKSLSSLRIEMSHLWTEQDRKNWASGTLEYNINSHISIYGTDMYNYGNDDPDYRDHYFVVGSSFSMNKTRLAVSYGRQRGGVLCVGGVCREVPAATGFSIDLTTSF